MRVTENMRFTTTVNNLFNAQAQYNDISEKIVSQKKVNRASDDPIAATKIIEIRQSMAANEQYKTNMNNCDAWLSVTESKLSSAFDLLVKANELALGQSTGTANATTREIAAQEVKGLIDEMASLANAMSGDRYLFSGSKNDAQPFSTTLLSPKIEAAASAQDNAFTGTVTSSGTYTGTTNKSYAVKITTAGVLAAATCQISTDGGRTWNGADLPMVGGNINLGDGVTLTFDDAGGTKPLGQNDVFYVNAIASGYYRGDNDPVTLTINRGTSLTYNVTGAEAFTSAGGYGVDVFKTLNALKDALDSDSSADISAELDNLKKAQNQVNLNQSMCGTKENHIEVSRSNLSELDTKLTSLLGEAQDADLAEMSTKLSMKEIALQASYAIAAKIGNTTILNFLK
jgi:flagellar hook-associated protein 3 FlgL